MPTTTVPLEMPERRRRTDAELIEEVAQEQRATERLYKQWQGLLVAFFSIFSSRGRCRIDEDVNKRLRDLAADMKGQKCPLHCDSESKGSHKRSKEVEAAMRDASFLAEMITDIPKKQHATYTAIESKQQALAEQIMAYCKNGKWPPKKWPSTRELARRMEGIQRQWVSCSIFGQFRAADLRHLSDRPPSFPLMGTLDWSPKPLDRAQRTNQLAAGSTHHHREEAGALVSERRARLSTAGQS